MMKKAMYSILIMLGTVSTFAHAATPHHATARAATDPFERTAAAAQSFSLRELTDQFASSGVDESLVGKPFKLHLNLEEDRNNDFKTAAIYYYENGALTINLFGYNNNRYVVKTHKIASGSYMGQNAFGARVHVSQFRILNDVLAVVGDLPPDGSDKPHGNYKFQKEMSGPAAKALAQDAQIIIEGVLANLPNGKLTDCEAGTTSATLAHPSDILEQSCAVGASVLRVAVIRKSTGAILQEWR